jgi:hypothetical protein
VPKKGKFTQERVEYNVFLFDEPLKAQNRLKSLKLAWRFVLTSCDIYQNPLKNEKFLKFWQCRTKNTILSKLYFLSFKKIWIETNNTVFLLCNLYQSIGCSFKFILKVGVEEWIVNAPRITDNLTFRVVCVNFSFISWKLKQIAEKSKHQNFPFFKLLKTVKIKRKHRFWYVLTSSCLFLYKLFCRFIF